MKVGYLGDPIVTKNRWPTKVLINRGRGPRAKTIIPDLTCQPPKSVIRRAEAWA